MMFVHVQPGIAENVYDRDAGLFDVVYFVLTRLLGLSSVSLLSVVSGYFVVASLLKSGAVRLVRSKMRTLIVPLIGWNLLMLALLGIYGLLTGKWHDMPELTVSGIGNALLALTHWPLDVPLWFLRDLFVCCVLSPVLYVGLKRAPIVTILVLVVYTVFGEGLLILQRPQLLLFFGLGMWLRIAGADPKAIDRWSRLLTVGLVVMVAIFLTIRIDRILLSDMDETLRLTLDTLLRVTMAGGFWLLTGAIRNSAFADALRKARTLRLLPVLQPRHPVQFRRHRVPPRIRQLWLGPVSDHLLLAPVHRGRLRGRGTSCDRQVTTAAVPVQRRACRSSKGRAGIPKRQKHGNRKIECRGAGNAIASRRPTFDRTFVTSFTDPSKTRSCNGPRFTALHVPGRWFEIT